MLLALALVCSGFAAMPAAFADEPTGPTSDETIAPLAVTPSGLFYDIEGGEIYITGCRSSLVSVVVPAEIDGMPVVCVELDFSDLTSLDVSACTQLKTLQCGDNQLTSLDVSKNTQLKTLQCGDNQLNFLDVSKNTQLKTLQCDENRLTSLDVSSCVELKHFSCYENQLTTLDMSKNTKLYDFRCQNNPLTTLDVSNNSELLILFCCENQLTTLDVSKNTGLGALDCSYNRLTTLNLSNNTRLSELWCSNNQLAALDISQNTNLNRLFCYNNYIGDTTALEARLLVCSWGGKVLPQNTLPPVTVAPTIAGDATITLTEGYAKLTKNYAIAGTPAPTVSLVGAPAGFSITPAGALTIPAGLKAGSYSFTIKAQNPVNTANKAVTVKVNQKLVKPAITGGKSKVTLKKNYKNTPVSFKIKGFPAPTLKVTAPKNIAKKITISKTGKLTIKKGIKPGTYKVTITAKNSQGKATKTVTIKVKK
ncbi:MAG: hypothetical protein LBB42_01115 [Coriobacteriales bacterium]|jgi:hypothetical protein|nr:hypothetical protein [Coriobacteriales bacterium]